ncbi:MAG: CDP-archaeol synthase [Chromatiales bacterium]|nr:CDP-archaeol synthase [Chromatiales bacterium]
MLFACNGAPILARLLLAGHFARPVDNGLRLWDGRPLFGRSKTWRGLLAGLAIGAVGAALLGWGWGFGLVFAFWSLLGDLLASFIKRRLGLDPSDQALGLDQLPEAVLPLMYASTVLSFGVAHVIGLSIAFAALSLAISRPLYHWHIRKRPW